MIYIVAYPHPSIPPAKRMFPFKAGTETYKEDLLEQLIKGYPKHSEDLRHATIWKAFELPTEGMGNNSSANESAYEWVNVREERGNVIEQWEPLVEHFPDGPRKPLGTWVDIVVVTEEILEGMDHQEDGVHGPRDDRRFGPPTALFDEALAILKYDLEHLEAFAPGKRHVEHAFGLVTTAASFFKTEEGRRWSLQPYLNALLASQEARIIGGDGVWLEGPFAYLIFGLNEQGLGGDPFSRSLIVYSKIIEQEACRKFISRSNLPVVLLSMSGNCLVVSTAIYTDAIYADKLLSVDLVLGTHGPDNVLRVARMFMAITRCADQLRLVYRGLETLPPVVPGVMYPRPTPCPPDAEIPHLEFFSKVDRAEGTPIDTVTESNQRHAIYLARTPLGPSTDGSTTVLVKFTARYNERAHRLLANHDPPLAPALHFCGRVVGDLYMVVMEYIAGASPLHRFFPPSALPRTPKPEVVRKTLTEALGLLHEQGIVFGDLRPLNILHSRDDDRVFLVDFDWAGKDGEDGYSPCLNDAVNLGGDVSRWEVMKKSHDNENLERVMKWHSDHTAIKCRRVE